MAGDDVPNEDAMLLDGFADCFVGWVSRFGADHIACYDRGRIIDSLIDNGLSHDEAEEHFAFNIIGSWVGSGTPCFLEYPIDE